MRNKLCDDLLAHPEAIDEAYEPERTWAVLHYFARSAPEPAAIFSRDAIAKRLQR